MGCSLPPAEHKRIMASIRNEIGLLMTTEGVRSDPLMVSDEINNGLYYCATTIWDTVPRIMQDLEEALAETAGDSVDIPPFLRYRTWIGGDRDGNPYVTTELTRQALERHRDGALENYLKEFSNVTGKIRRMNFEHISMCHIIADLQ